MFINIILINVFIIFGFKHSTNQKILSSFIQQVRSDKKAVKGWILQYTVQTMIEHNKTLSISISFRDFFGNHENTPPNLGTLEPWIPWN